MTSPNDLPGGSGHGDQDAWQHDWQARLTRCRKLADLLRADPEGGRLAALAHEIEQGVARLVELATLTRERRRHGAAMLLEIDGIVRRCRDALFLRKHLLLAHAYSADDLREEARLCEEEARAAIDIEGRRQFAHRAFDLAQLAEAVARSAGGEPGQPRSR